MSSRSLGIWLAEKAAVGPRGLTANKAPRPFLDGDDFRAGEGEWLMCLGRRQGRAPQTSVSPLCQSVVGTEGPPPVHMALTVPVPACPSAWGLEAMG